MKIHSLTAAGGFLFGLIVEQMGKIYAQTMRDLHEGERDKFAAGMGGQGRGKAKMSTGQM